MRKNMNGLTLWSAVLVREVVRSYVMMNVTKDEDATESSYSISTSTGGTRSDWKKPKGEVGTPTLPPSHRLDLNVVSSPWIELGM